MKSPITLKEIQSLIEQATALNRFPSRSIERCKPFFKAIKRKYLTSPPLLSKLEAADDLYIYLAVSKAIKAQTLVDFIAEFTHSLSDVTDWPNDAPEAAKHTLAVPAPTNGDFWHLHVNGASNYKGTRVSMVLVTPYGSVLEQVITLGFKESNNEAKYKALLAGL
ncbi:hypothetical protein FF2_043163 [Malus domestica]